MTRARKRKIILLTAVLCLLVAGEALTSVQFRKADDNVIVTAAHKPKNLEIPVFTISRAEQRIEHIGYTVSYNPHWRIPNWVAYELTAEEAQGTVPRAQHFEKDPEVKGVCADPRDYTNSNYDRGHMAPAGDMKWSWPAMQESFYMSNICPQDHKLNSGDWNTLEKRVRNWAVAFQKIYVACGPIVAEKPKTIGENKVAVPDSFFKVLLCQQSGRWQAIGFLCPNEPVHHNLSEYCKTIDEIEALTGIDFFPALPDKTEKAVEANYDLSAWNIRK